MKPAPRSSHILEDVLTIKFGLPDHTSSYGHVGRNFKIRCDLFMVHMVDLIHEPRNNPTNLDSDREMGWVTFCHTFTCVYSASNQELKVSVQLLKFSVYFMDFQYFIFSKYVCIYIYTHTFIHTHLYIFSLLKYFDFN